MTNNSHDTKNTLTNDDLMGLIVHSYNNYLAGIMGYSELAMLECENTEVEDRLKSSLESGIDAVHFGKTILASLGRLQVPMQVCSLVKILRSIGEKKQQLTTELNFAPLENIKIKTDSKWFEECLIDLAEFASSIEKDIRIKFIVDHQDNLVIITINCGALSLAEQDIKNLFEPFYSSRKLTGQKDIGLAKVKGFVTQMNASLNWKNELGFVLEIPIEA